VRSTFQEKSPILGLGASGQVFSKAGRDASVPMANVLQANPRGAVRVEAFIADQPKALQPILAAARALLDEGLPGATCSIKWNLPVWTGKGNVAALMVHAQHVNLQLFKGSGLPDPQGRLEGKGQAMRHVKLRAARDVKDPAVKALVRNAWRNDQA
jgi:hypothetical protein